MTKDSTTVQLMSGLSLDLDTRPTQAAADAAHKRFLEMAHTSAMEGNPMSAEHIALFERFRRERWTDAEIEAHIDGLLRDLAGSNV